MRYAALLTVLITSLAIVTSCDEPPELPLEPTISFNDIQFKKGENGRDSLILTLNFEDGDGDLGLNDDFDEPPFNEYDLVLDDNGDVIHFGAPNQPPYNINDWLLRDLDGDNVTDDTVRIQFNENYHNIFIDFFFKNTQGEYVEIDLKSRVGFNFNGRFPILNTSDNERPLRGTLTYKMVAAFSIDPLFRTNTLKLDVEIQDRGLNRSNKIDTPDFTLQ
ncbi:hypothetical protein QQ008_08470 [Fulvivirgaceae bacterium BMA10]|uniref:Uncharacterized protein n=1 Tax=Splendidivirga corallicola TaxID=3051826 RepID=A0ABT8KMX6_9BACT|nr:hypothetical protein [Fulvivirgaceae bacterium BMA10]